MNETRVKALRAICTSVFVMAGCSHEAAPPKAPPDTTSAPAGEAPAMMRNGLPGPMHARLNVLVGEWNVVKSLYIAAGTPEKPVVTQGLICRRQWIEGTGKRFLQDVTEGPFPPFGHYYRMGILGYANMDRRYEWNTMDGFNAAVMSYRSESGDDSETITMFGSFIDQGVLGEPYVGKTIAMRTVVKIESADRHTFQIYMTAPGGKEVLADGAVYTRRR